MVGTVLGRSATASPARPTPAARRAVEAGGRRCASMAIVSPCDTTARYLRHGHIVSWKGFGRSRSSRGENPAPGALAGTGAAGTVHVRVEPQTSTWRVRYAVRFGGGKT
ncbi:hypothetical protein CTZ40_02755 [Streptomyces rimosus]|nr:hypothetical protein CTZ40_02755 [Streptomyces rimosus]